MLSTDMSMGFSQKIALPARAAPLDKVEMGIGGRADDHRVDIGRLEDHLRAAHLGAQVLGQPHYNSAASGTASATA